MIFNLKPAPARDRNTIYKIETDCIEFIEEYARTSGDIPKSHRVNLIITMKSGASIDKWFFQADIDELYQQMKSEEERKRNDEDCYRNLEYCKYLDASREAK